MGRVFYCTRDEVQDAFDVREAAHRSAQIDTAIASASDDIDGWLNRHKHGLAPVTATRYFAFPTSDYSRPYRLWLDENELISVTSLTSGGNVLVANTDYYLEPVNSGPPFTYIETNTGGNAVFDIGTDGSSQRSIRLDGLWGLNDDRKAAGTLALAVNASVTTVNVSDASLVGVGSLLNIDDERMLVTGSSALTTGDTVQATMNAQMNAQILQLTSGANVHVGETLLIDAERVRVLSIAGNNATVIRAYDGTTLAAHSIGATVYAFRTMTVERGARGSTAASHLLAAPLTTWAVPDLVRALARAEAISRIEQEFSAYGARVYSDEAERDSSGTDVISGRGLTDIRKSVARRYKRKFRVRAV